ncbi:GNAT family N-acetyltransferase [Nonomuraea sp. NN258]|uniref:GNAT family N-acetyltransferase n=1 Tax=Nonomuraea antri TaxID=2730852 RepID=UPI001569C91A|nr:GNAT family N-acetyltransferase [Nonomuraea antri]NRQ38328.1 GNAT family N-acetyltransferase [Nonomuraea antri]
MSLTLQTLDPRHDPEPGDWEELRLAAGRLVTWRYDLLRAYAWAAQAPVLLTVLRRDGVAVGAVSASLRGVRPRRGRYAGYRDRAGLLDVHAPANRSQKGWWFTGGVREPERRDLLRGYLRGVRAELGRGWTSAVWREVSPGEPALLPGRVKLRLPTAPLARIATPWPDLGPWYALLDRARRDSLRRRAKTLAADLDIATGPARDLVTGAEVAALRAENDLKHRGRLFPLAPLPVPYLDALVGGDEVVAVAYRERGGRLLGLSLVLDHPSWPVALSWGSVPIEDGGRKHLYFDVYVRLIEWAIGAGRAGLVLGKGQAEIKTGLGAELVPSDALAVPF